MGIQIAAFNHILTQHPAVRVGLATHAGRRVAVQLPPFHVAGMLTEHGWLVACEDEPEGTVRFHPSIALLRMAKRAQDISDIQLEGDIALATAVGHLLIRLRWSVAEDLSRLVGDAITQRAETVFSSLLGAQKRVAWQLAKSYTEYLTEEMPVLAGRRQVQSLFAAVDSLHQDASHLEKHLAQIKDAPPEQKKA